ncbi:MAG: serine/threonine protein kinase [Myxococcota bacterium]|jgi:serine/threonine protein kinase
MSRAGIRGQHRLSEHHLRSLLAVRPLERVYEGTARGTETPVIIRQLLPGLPADQHEETIQLFEAHLERMVRLTDPGTLPIREHVSATDGPMYVVTDTPVGSTIGELVRDAGSLPAALVAALGTSIAQKLAHAHECGVTHASLRRDLILVDSSGRISVLDLGVVPMLLDRTQGKLKRVHIAWDSLFPEPGAVAPEILAGDAVTPSTDIYGLGALLYLMATAHMPYDGQAVVVYNAILSGTQPVDPRDVIADLDPQLADLIAECLKRDPAERPESMSVVQKRLAELSPVELADALGPITPIVSDRLYTDRFKPLLRLVAGGGGRDMVAEEPAGPGVVSLFSNPNAAPMSDGELLARMSNEQREIYFAGSSAMQERPKRQDQTRRGMILGFLLTALLLVWLLPQLISSTPGTQRGHVELAPADVAASAVDHSAAGSSRSDERLADPASKRARYPIELTAGAAQP